MKKFLSVFAAALMIGSFAHAAANESGDNSSAPESHQTGDVHGVSYTCTVQGEIAGGSIGVILGGEYISGPGTVTCRNGADVQTIPVRMRLIGFGPSFDLTWIKSIRVRTANIGVVGGPEALLQNYSIGASAGASLVTEGVEFDTAIKVAATGGLSFELGLQGRDVLGLGAHLYGMAFSIERR